MLRTRHRLRRTGTRWFQERSFRAYRRIRCNKSERQGMFRACRQCCNSLRPRHMRSRTKTSSHRKHIACRSRNSRCRTSRSAYRSSAARRIRQTPPRYILRRMLPRPRLRCHRHRRRVDSLCWPVVHKTQEPALPIGPSSTSSAPVSPPAAAPSSASPRERSSRNQRLRKAQQ